MNPFPPNLTRRAFLKYGAVAGAVAGVGALSYTRYIEPERLSLERVTIPIPGLPDALEASAWRISPSGSTAPRR